MLYDCRNFTIDAAGLSDEYSTERAAELWISTDSGPFVGSIDLEVSLDGSTWTRSQLGGVGPELYAQVPELAKAVRFNCTAHTSGSLVACVAFNA